MKTKKVIFYSAILTCLFIFLSGLPDALAGGRTIEPRHPLSESILFTTWYRNSIINIAVCNVSYISHLLKIATGTCDVGRHIYSTQSLEIPSHSIKLVYFPLLKQQTSRGNLKTSDYVFLFSEDPETRGLIDFKTVQNIYTRYANASLDNFIVASGQNARFSYTMETDEALRIILISKLLKTNNSQLIPGEPTKETIMPANIEKIKELSLPISYENQIIKSLKGNYCFIIKRGEGATITVTYDIPEIINCSLATIPVYRYIFEQGGGLYRGGGRGLTFMIYNPNVVQIRPLLRLSTESNKAIYRFKQ